MLEIVDWAYCPLNLSSTGFLLQRKLGSDSTPKIPQGDETKGTLKMLENK